MSAPSRSTPLTPLRRFDVDAIRRANPLAARAAAAGVALHRVGRALVGRCPFHADGGDPNLHVYANPDPARDSWFCFRCHAGGDVIAFVMQRDDVEFVDACRRLGGQAVPAPLARLAPAEEPRRWDRLSLAEQVVMNTAHAVYRENLRNEPRALAYLRARGVPEEAVETCGLGYADGQTLERFLRRRHWLRLGERLGLLRRPEKDDDGTRPLREPLAGRIVIPELRGGNCVWMIGRWVGAPGERPKYLSLPGERPLLGLERASGQTEAFLVEGAFGYLVAVGWGLPAFSPCGTWVPAHKLGFLARARTVWGLLDPDPAGREAAARCAELLGRRWRPLWLPGGREIDALAAEEHGARTFFRFLAAARREAARDRNEENGHDDADP
jgi:DNA primase